MLAQLDKHDFIVTSFITTVLTLSDLGQRVLYCMQHYDNIDHGIDFVCT